MRAEVPLIVTTRQFKLDSRHADSITIGYVQYTADTGGPDAVLMAVNDTLTWRSYPGSKDHLTALGFVICATLLPPSPPPPLPPSLPPPSQPPHRLRQSRDR